MISQEIYQLFLFQTLDLGGHFTELCSQVGDRTQVQVCTLIRCFHRDIWTDKILTQKRSQIRLLILSPCCSNSNSYLFI